jgi:drug/metabolite transporter (DMT)-like permease
MNKVDVSLGLASGVFIGLSVVILSYVTKTVHPLVFMTISPIISLPFLAAISLFLKGQGLRTTIRNHKKDFLTVFFERFLVAGLVMTFGFSLTLAIRAVFITQLESAFVFAWSALLLKESVRKSKLFMIATLIIGAFLVTTEGNLNVFESVMLGDLLIITALVLLSHSYIPSARFVNANLIRLSMWFTLLSTPFFAALALIFLPVSAFYVSAYNLILVAMASILFNVIGLPLWFISLRKLKPWVVASSLIVQTLSGAVLSFFWLGQTLSPVQMVGGIIILVSVYFIASKGGT